MSAKRPKRLGVYAGSFDPLTIGHLWMIEEGARLFERLIVAVGINPDKRQTFSVGERLVMLQESCRTFRNVSVAIRDAVPLTSAACFGLMPPASDEETRWNPQRIILSLCRITSS